MIADGLARASYGGLVVLSCRCDRPLHDRDEYDDWWCHKCGRLADWCVASSQRGEEE